MSKFIIAQIIGFLAVGCTLLTYQFNNRRVMLGLNLTGSLLYAIHFSLLGAKTGASMNVLSMGRAIVFLHYSSSKRPDWLLYFVIGAFIVAGILTWQGWYSILPIIGMCVMTYAFWQLRTKRIRYVSLISPPCWFAYNFIVGSYAGMTAEIVNLVSNLIGRWRFDRKTDS